MNILNYLWIAMLAYTILAHVVKIIYELSNKKAFSKLKNALLLENSRWQLIAYYVLAIFALAKGIAFTIDKL